MTLIQALVRALLGPGAFGEEQSSARPAGARPQKMPKGSPFFRLLISLGVTALFGCAYFYVFLPAINLHAGALYRFVFWLCAVFSACMIFLKGFRADNAFKYIPYVREKLAVPFYLVLLMIAVVAVGSAMGWVAFRARAYSRLLVTETGDFAAEVAEISWDQIPMLDEDSANNLANRKLGELSDLVSQFAVSPISAQINYKNAPVRVTYLNYENFFKWWNNRGDGIPAYMIVDMVTQEVTVVRLEEGIKYSPSEYFNRDLTRWLRFQYPTLLFDDVNFEIDDNGTPYWIASVIRKTIGLFGGTDVAGAVLVNAVTGEATYCGMGDIPTWVDRVAPSDLILEQYDYYGRYHNGLVNALFSQEDCTATTDGYNYIAKDDDVWLYTGITSVSGDRGNIGFILVNQRTKASRYFSCAGAEEFSAMSSGEGAVQQYSYEATFPLLLNISNQPTYFMALKDTAGLVKMYAMVNVQQYQIVATGSTVAECQTKYHSLMAASDIELTPGAEPAEYGTVTGEVAEIRAASMDGDTHLFLLLAGGDLYYDVNVSDFPLAIILDVGDEVTVTFDPAEEGPIVRAVTLTAGG